MSIRLSRAGHAAQHPYGLTKQSTLLTAVLVLAAALAGPFLSTAGASERASCNRGQFPTTCDVTEPYVRQAFTGYSQIQLFARQHVFIQAGGCVQTGGRGKTWKRYVDPAADNDSYHGLIYIPGATNGYVRLNSVVNTTVTIPQDTSLNLGYEDDGSSRTPAPSTATATMAITLKTTEPATSAKVSGTPGFT